MTFELEPSPKLKRLKRHGAACSFCGGRGWGEAINGWPVTCPKCHGRGVFRMRELVRALGVHRRDLYRVEDMRVGTKVGVRVLDAIARAFPWALA